MERLKYRQVFIAFYVTIVKYLIFFVLNIAIVYLNIRFRMEYKLYEAANIDKEEPILNLIMGNFTLS
jgi:hypothetical protein